MEKDVYFNLRFEGSDIPSFAIVKKREASELTVAKILEALEDELSASVYVSSLTVQAACGYALDEFTEAEFKIEVEDQNPETVLITRTWLY